MAQTRFQCSLTRAGEPVCELYARLTIVDSDGATARGCARHAVAALDGITGAHVDWADSKGLNEWERKALELSEERSSLGYSISYVKASRSRDRGRQHVTTSTSPQDRRAIRRARQEPPADSPHTVDVPLAVQRRSLSPQTPGRTLAGIARRGRAKQLRLSRRPVRLIRRVLDRIAHGNDGDASAVTARINGRPVVVEV